MFKNSFFHPYLQKYSLKLLLNILLRICAATFNAVLLIGIAPTLTIIFENTEDLTTVGNPDFMDSFFHHVKSYISVSVMQNGQQKTLLYLVLALCLLYFLKNLFSYAAMFFYTSYRTSCVGDIRNRFYKKTLDLPISFYSKTQRGDLISRFSNDVKEIDENILIPLQNFLNDFLTFLILFISLFFISTSLTLIVLLILPAASLIISKIGHKLKKNAPKLQESAGELTSKMDETLQGIKTICSFNAEEFSIRSYRQENEKFGKLKRSIFRRIDLASPCSEIIGSFTVIILLLIGGSFIFSESDFAIAPEVFITYIVMLTQLINPAKNISVFFYNLKKGKVSTQRIKEILAEDERITDRPDALDFPYFEKEIRFENVNLVYPNTMALKSVNLSIPKGSFVGIVGPSGSGKSSLVNLIPRFYDCTEGRILIDGTDIRNIKLKDLRSVSAIVSQDIALFNDSFYNNILLGNPHATEAEIVQASKDAHCHEFIMQTPNGYQSLIGDGGNKLSGGQRQRLSIARALLSKADIFIFDEATSALDTISEQLIQESVQKLHQQNRKTIISIAHRLSSIQNADFIVVMKEGRIVETGNAKELMQRNGVYTQLCRAQNIEEI